MPKHITILSVILLLYSCAPAPQQPPHSAGFNYLELNIAQVHRAFRAKQISCEQLVQRYLARIAAYDQPTHLNAIIYINPNAISRARQLDKKFGSIGKMRKLHCIPVILKDNFDTADMPTEAGSIALKGSLPPDDAFMVKRLRSEDAIIIAKSNMGEWAFSPYETISSTHGETRNAYDLQRVPAGSSGGTAAAIAANFGIIGMGSDTGNSIRGPASHLDLVGIRSTIGATSRDGIVPLLLNRDIGGPLTRTVTDAARVYSVLAGFDPADPATQAGIGKVKPDYLPYLKQDGLKGARIGVLRELFDTDSTEFEISDLMDKAIADLRKAGAVIVDPFTIPDLQRLTKATGFCSRFRYDLDQYLASLGDKAPVKSLQQVVEKKRYREQNQQAMDWAMSVNVAPQAQTPPCVDVQGDPRRKALLDAVVKAMDAMQVDALIYPSWSNPPRLLGDKQSPHGNNSPLIAPHSGQPALTVPMGFVENKWPAGLQFLARPFDEHKLFQYAYAYEQATRHRRPPAGFGALK